MAGFSYLDDVLTSEGVRLDTVATAVGTPFYVYSAHVIRQRFRDLETGLAGVPHAIHYALKANSTLAIVRLLRDLGADVDANSIGEIDVALRAGYQAGQIVFTGVGKAPSELARAVPLGLKAINAESPGELERIDAIARASGTRARVALRVNPDVDAGSHPHISTGLRRNKFGVALEQALPIIREAARRPGLRFVGLHTHIGSQMTTLEPITRAITLLAALARTVIAEGIPLEHLDVGGGLGISYDGSGTPDLQAYATAVRHATADLGLSLIVEPGRSLTAPAGALIASIVDVKHHPGGRRFVVLDAGMTELLRPALYGAFHRIQPVVRDDRAPATCDVVGPVCESSDTFGTDRQLPDPRVGDLVAVMDVGAYGAVMASNYNRRPLPAEVMVDGDAWRVVRRRQRIDDLLALEE